MSTLQIIAMGGGFGMEPENPMLVLYVLNAAGKPRPKACFLAQASGESQDYILRFYAAFSQHNRQPSHLSLFRPPTADLEGFLLEKDVIYVGGGNSKSMLALWREWGLDGILRKAWECGVVLAGLSAGAICWFEQGHTDSVPGLSRPSDRALPMPGPLSPLPCLGFLEGSCSPHYDGEAARRPSFQHFVGAGQLKDGYGVEDGVALHFIGSEIKNVVSSRPNSRAYRVQRSAGGAIENPIPTSYLG